MRRPRTHSTKTPYGRHYQLSALDVVFKDVNPNTIPFAFRRDKKRHAMQEPLMAKTVVMMEDEEEDGVVSVIRECKPSFSDWQSIVYVPLEGMLLVFSGYRTMVVMVMDAYCFFRMCTKNGVSFERKCGGTTSFGV
jgi:hypothetical protein